MTGEPRTPVAGPTPLGRLKKRAEFLAVAQGRRVDRRAFALQALGPAGDAHPARVGFTVTKKIGTATERNRIRRRLRAAIAEAADAARLGDDYVLIGRRAALSEPFGDLVSDLRRALARQASAAAGGKRRRGSAPSPS